MTEVINVVGIFCLTYGGYLTLMQTIRAVKGLSMSYWLAIFATATGITCLYL